MSDEEIRQELTFWEHAEDLRLHLLFGFIFFIITAIVLFSSGTRLLSYILTPLEGRPLIFLSPLEPILFQMNIAFLGALMVSLPVWLLTFYHFIHGALPKNRKLPFFILVLTSLIFGILAIALTYKLVMPFSLDALSRFVIPGTSMMLTSDSYISFFVLSTMVTFFILELPIVVIALSYLRIINPYRMGHQRRFLIPGLIAVLAIVTPTTDVITLIIVTIPTIILSEVGLFIAKITYKSN